MRDEQASGGLTALLPESARSPFLNCVSAMLDQFAFARLAQAGVEPGHRCLVVGTGTANAARWLSDAVGPGGVVEAAHSADLAVNGPFDLIYSRMALADRPKPSCALADLVDLLKPGGAMVVDEWQWSARVLAASQPDTGTLYARYQHALVTTLAMHGCDIGWAERVPAAMLDAGLVAVDVAAHSRSWPSGTPGTTFDLIVVTELRDHLIAAGVSAESLDLLQTCLADPHLLVLGNLTISTIGRRQRTSETSALIDRARRS